LTMRRNAFRCSSTRRACEGSPFGDHHVLDAEVGEWLVDFGFAVATVGGDGLWRAPNSFLHPRDRWRQLRGIGRITLLDGAVEHDAIDVCRPIPIRETMRSRGWHDTKDLAAVGEPEPDSADGSAQFQPVRRLLVSEQGALGRRRVMSGTRRKPGPATGASPAAAANPEQSSPTALHPGDRLAPADRPGHPIPGSRPRSLHRRVDPSAKKRSHILNDPIAWTQPRRTNGRRLRGYGCVTEPGNGPTFGRTSLWKHKAF
jgi:hypothetical protein